MLFTKIKEGVPFHLLLLTTVLLNARLVCGQATGARGAQGRTGNTGPAGYVGVVGPMGPIGPRGVSGRTGATGATGQGGQGATGADGLPGRDGMNGFPGPAGPSGPRGVPGSIVGATGATGAQGSPGGATGATGPKGRRGPPGAPGSSMPLGFNSVKGKDGKQKPLTGLWVFVALCCLQMILIIIATVFAVKLTKRVSNAKTNYELLKKHIDSNVGYEVVKSPDDVTLKM